MATTAVSRRRGSASIAEQRAAKERRQKIIAFAGLGILIVVLAIELPSLLGRGSGSSPSSTTSTPTVTAPTPTAPQATNLKAYHRALRTAPRDIFASTGASGTTPAYGAASTPAGLHDPFAQPGSSAGTAPPPVAPPPSTALPAKIVIGTPGAGRVATSGWIVILASIPTDNGQAAANSFAQLAKSRGISSVSILNSSNRRPLRGGYWVVYTGPYPNLAAVTSASGNVHSQGFGDAYIRQLIVYRKK
jgi:hypothetical protein